MVSTDKGQGSALVSADGGDAVASWRAFEKGRIQVSGSVSLCPKEKACPFGPFVARALVTVASGHLSQLQAWGGPTEAGSNFITFERSRSLHARDRGRRVWCDNDWLCLAATRGGASSFADSGCGYPTRRRLHVRDYQPCGEQDRSWRKWGRAHVAVHLSSKSLPSIGGKTFVCW